MLQYRYPGHNNKITWTKKVAGHQVLYCTGIHGNFIKNTYARARHRKTITGSKTSGVHIISLMSENSIIGLSKSCIKLTSPSNLYTAFTPWVYTKQKSSSSSFCCFHDNQELAQLNIRSPILSIHFFPNFFKILVSQESSYFSHKARKISRLKSDGFGRYY